MVRFPKSSATGGKTVKDFTASIYLEGEYNQDMYDLNMVEQALQAWALDGFIPDNEDIEINEALISGGAVWQ